MKEESVGSSAVAVDLEGYKVLGIGDEKIGTVEGTWEDQTGKPIFITVKTGMMGMGQAHFVPIHDAEIFESHKTIRVPFHKDRVHRSPDFKSESKLDAISESKLYEYYGRQGESYGRYGESATEGAVSDRRMGEDRREKREESRENKEERKEGLKEKFEDLKSGKKETRTESSGAEGVGLRKVLYTKRVEEFEPGKPPVEGTGILKEFKQEEEISPLRDKVAEIKKAADMRSESVSEKLEEAKERLERDRGNLG